ncbi:hypothetical protein P153DRAFT_369363 [Dothidotthia symphoricarpi CBS 119687]|uniref:Uncharacterized protein n=1 Tax=Dothidotthia symphoricarpi CBS 119687 TaxID=1392245 RepID=A0A6A6A2A6_9PLEO|nr:uncharacterized protein P153DRAFT_369363 [Dothidotthia symphoricarpi CBS 119687]KAF2125979.1 hypothetical protein P153DRAFT_369363 [Dothidotthia symphoricarpi CBS 119687]
MDHVFPGTAGIPGYRYRSSANAAASPSTLLLSVVIGILIGMILNALLASLPKAFERADSSAENTDTQGDETVPLYKLLVTRISASAVDVYRAVVKHTYALFRRVLEVLRMRMHICVRITRKRHNHSIKPVPLNVVVPPVYPDIVMTKNDGPAFMMAIGKTAKCINDESKRIDDKLKRVEDGLKHIKDELKCLTEELKCIEKDLHNEIETMVKKACASGQGSCVA